MNPDGTFNFTVVNSTDGTFRVHRAGCADITRRMQNGSWNVAAKDAEAVVARERESLRGDFGDEADEFVFTILPCADIRAVRNFQGVPV